MAKRLKHLTGAYPELRQHLYTAEGKLRSFVNLYLNDDDIRYLPQKEATPVEESDELTIIPSIAGGYLAVRFELVRSAMRESCNAI